MLALLFAASTTMLSGCGEKQVPIYRGMGWGDSSISNSIGMSYSVRKLPLLSNGDANGNSIKYGCYSGDYAGKDVTIDAENPFSDKESDNRLLDLLKQKAGGIFGNIGDNAIVIRPSQPDFEDIFSPSSVFLNIFIYNPDNFEIVSFVLNGEQYTGEAFESTSSMEKIVVKPRVIQTASGGYVATFEISDIKYRDGDEIKDVIMGGSNTIGANGGDVPTATVSDMVLADGRLSFNVNLDKASTTIVKGEMFAVIFDGERLVASQDIFVGDNSVTFEGLSPNTVYQCAVGGYYYGKSSDAGQLQILYKYAFYTDPVVLFDTVTVEAESISFDYLWSEGQSAKQITAIRLYRDGICEAVLDASTTTITALLAGTSYSLVAEYVNGENTESISLEFTTLDVAAKAGS